MEGNLRNPFNELKLSLTRKSLPSGPLEFVNVTNPNELKLRNTRQAIRRQAGRSGAHKRQKHRRPVVHVFELPPSQPIDKWPSEEHSHGIGNGMDESIPTKHVTIWRLTSLLRPLGAGLAFNPYQYLPINHDAQTSLLIEFLIDSANKRYQPMLHIWISVALEDKSSFHLLLANAATLLDEHHQVETLEGTKQYTIALNQLNARLNNPQESMTEGVIGAILGFSCQDARLSRFDRWTIHMSGLKKIIDLRGGIDTLKSAYNLRLSMFMVDMNGSLSIDRIPVFPSFHSPLNGKAAIGNHLRLHSTLESLKLRQNEVCDVCKALYSVADLAEFMNTREANQDLWQDEMVYSQNVLPVVHQVLSLQRRYPSDHPSSPADRTREILRLTCLLFLSLVQRCFSIKPDSVPNYKRRVLELLMQSQVDWTPFKDLYLWALSVSAVAAFGEERMWIVAEIDHSRSSMSWQDVTAAVSSVAWIEQATAYQLEILGQEVQCHSVKTK